jgi:hypothetical protein
MGEKPTEDTKKYWFCIEKMEKKFSGTAYLFCPPADIVNSG